MPVVPSPPYQTSSPFSNADGIESTSSVIALFIPYPFQDPDHKRVQDTNHEGFRTHAGDWGK